MRRFRIHHSALFVLIIGSLTVAHGQDTLLIDFKSKDQLDRVHVDEDYVGQTLVVVGFDRKGSDFRDSWVGVLRDSLRDPTGDEDADVLPVATLKGVPFFLKGFLKGKFPKEEQRWMLLDWKGQFTTAYDFAPDSCSFLVFTSKGRLSCRAAGAELDYELLGRLLACIREQKVLPSPEDDADPRQR